jgi:hypothetical protein
MKKSQPFRTGGAREETESAGARNTLTGQTGPEIDQGTTLTTTGSTASNARSRITHRRNAAKEFLKINCAETNKDVPIFLKCV